METDNPACLPAVPPAGRGPASTAIGCRINAFSNLVASGYGQVMRAPSWTYAALAGLGLIAALLLALI